MPAIVEFPQVVSEALPEFADIFSRDPQRRHFAEYLTGLLVARKKNVSAIYREFANTTDQSCLKVGGHAISASAKQGIYEWLDRQLGPDPAR